MNKRGQITIFIIIAIILVAAIVGFFIFREELKGISSPAPETNEVYLFVGECIEEVGIEAVYDIGQTGGYFFPPEFSTDSEIAYYYSNGKSHMPSRGSIEKEISYYVNEMLFFCTRNFVDFPDFNITQREIKTETRIKNDEIILNVEYPLSITKGESTSLFKDFKNIKIPIRLGVIYNAIEEIMQEQLADERICLSCILDISLENDLYVNMFDYDEETVIIIIRDENSKINGQAFEFVFANKYEIK